MGELIVYEKKNDLFTDSFIIAEHSENEHESIKKHIREHEVRFKVLGKVAILNRTLDTKGGKWGEKVEEMRKEKTPVGEQGSFNIKENIQDQLQALLNCQCEDMRKMYIENLSCLLKVYSLVEFESHSCNV